MIQFDCICSRLAQKQRLPVKMLLRLRDTGQFGFLAFVMVWLFFGSASLAQSQPDEPPVRIGRSELRLTRTNDFMQLRYGSEAVAEGQAIRLAAKLEADGYEAALFEVSPGNGICRGGLVAVVARKNEEARFDRRLIDSCAGFTIERQADTLLLIEAPRLASNGSLWRFSASAGLRLVGQLEFAPEPGTGFRDLKTANTGSAAELLANQAIHRAIQSLAGASSKAYMRALTGFANAPAVNADNELQWVFAGCATRQSCELDAAMLVIDRKLRAVYLAQRVASGKTISWPDIARWPVEAKERFLRWSGKHEKPRP